MSLLSQLTENLTSNPDKDSDDKKLSQLSLPNEEIFSGLRDDFSKIFHDNNLDVFTNASDIGIREFSRMPSKTFESTSAEDYLGLQDFNKYSRAGSKEIAPSHTPVEQGVISSPLRFSQTEPFFPNFGSQNSGIFHNGLNMRALFSPNSLGLGSTPFDTAEKAPVNKEQMSQDYVDTYTNDPVSLMWSEDRSRPLKNVTNQPTSANQRESSFGCADLWPKLYENNNSQESKLSLFEHLKMELFSAKKTQQDLSAPIKRPQSQIEPKIEIPKFEKSSTETKTSEISSRLAFGNKKSKKGSVTSRKLRDAFKQEEEDENGFEKKEKQSRGLRGLSSMVRDIVIDKERTTYKEVADTLVRMLRKPLKEKTPAESKEEQNVKRRVYDALNVLIASGVLNKNGKVVSFNEDHCPAFKVEKHQTNKRICMQLEDGIAVTKKRKQDKLDVLQELMNKSIAIKHLVERNKADRQVETNSMNAAKVQIKSETPSYSESSNDIIKFPFLVMVSSKENNALNLNMDVSQKKLLVESKESLNLYGDIDVILKMGLHRISRPFFEEHLPKDLEKFMYHPFLPTQKQW